MRDGSPKTRTEEPARDLTRDLARAESRREQAMAAQRAAELQICVLEQEVSDTSRKARGQLIELQHEVSTLRKRVVELEVERGTGPQWEPRLNGEEVANLGMAELVQLAAYHQSAMECAKATLMARRMVEERETELKLCVICQEEEKCTLLVPCGHLCVCEPCSHSVAECPMCRSAIRQRLRAYS